MRLRVSKVLFLSAGACVVAGCGSRGEGFRILEDLRHDGLVFDHGDEVAPQLGAAGDDFAWPAEGAITVTILLEAADHLNPRIAAARADVGAAGGRAWQAALHPNPALELESENVRPSGGGFGVSETTVSVRQPIIVGGRLDAATRAGEAGVSAERWGLERVRREVHGRVRRAATEIAFDREAMALHEQLRVLAQRTLDVAQTRFEARAAPESEAIRARVELNMLVLAIERLRGSLAASGVRLEAVLGGRSVDVARVIADRGASSAVTLPPLDQLSTIVRTEHPAVLAAEASVDVAERTVDLERAHRHPDITARVGVGVNHADDEAFVEAGIGIPLPVSNRNQGTILAARFGVMRARQEAAAISNELVGVLSEAYVRLESAAGRLGALETQVLAGAQRSYEQTSAGYEAGKLPFLDLLDAQRTLIEATIAQSDLRREVSLARSEIEVILGRPLGPKPEYEDQS